MIKKSILEAVESAFLKVFAFVTAVAISFITSGIVETLIKPSNPYDIVNTYTASGFSPEQNFLRVLWIIGFTIAFYYLIRHLILRRPKLLRLFIVALSCFAILTVYLVPYSNALKGNVDAFHFGEQLAPANAYNEGKGLFSDMYVLHGAGEDVVLPALSLRLAAPDSGIGMYYFVMITLQIVSAALFIALLAYLFKNTALFLATSTWFTFGTYSTFYYIRDIFIWITLALVIYAIRNNSNKLTPYAYGAMGLTSSAALFFAIDRGIVAVVIAGMAAVASTALTMNDKKIFFAIPKRLNQFTSLVSFAIGLAVVQLIAIGLLGVQRYGDFVQTYFIDIPKYQGLLFNYPIFEISLKNFTIWLPLLVASIAIMMLAPLIIGEFKRKSFQRTTILATILLAGGIFFMRAGYGRSDFIHISYATPLLFIATFYIMYLVFTARTAIKRELWLPVFLVTLLFIPVTTLSFDKFTLFLNVSPRKSIESYKNLRYVTDQQWAPQQINDVTSYIKDNSPQNGSLFIFTQQPIYYYLSNRENPTRFYIPWFADPAPLEDEMLASLKAKNPDVILYTSGNSWDNVDGASMQLRAPEVDKWILENYTVKEKVGDATLLKRPTK